MYIKEAYPKDEWQMDSNVKGKTGPFGYHPEEVEAWLKAHVQAPGRS